MFVQADAVLPFYQVSSQTFSRFGPTGSVDRRYALPSDTWAFVEARANNARGVPVELVGICGRVKRRVEQSRLIKTGHDILFDRSPLNVIADGGSVPTANRLVSVANGLAAR
jgi:hypothetical protein